MGETSMTCKPRKVAPEELVCEFNVSSLLRLCSEECDKRELEVVTEKTCTGFWFSRVVCKHTSATKGTDK